MCGRFVRSFEDVRKTLSDFGLPVGEDHCKQMRPDYNICPSKVVAILTSKQLIPAIWGFCPDWLKDKTKTQINARLDTLFDKPMFRGSARQSRCLVPASGYYAWSPSEKGKTPHYIFSKTQDMFLMAGIYTDDLDGNATLAIVTKSALGSICEIEDRMPLSFDQPESALAWLHEAKFDNPMKELSYKRVSREVNNPQNNSDALIREASIEES